MCHKRRDLHKHKNTETDLQKAPHFSEDLYPLITLSQVAGIHIHHLPQGKSPLTVVQGDMVSTVPSQASRLSPFSLIAERKQILCLPFHPTQTIKNGNGTLLVFHKRRYSNTYIASYSHSYVLWYLVH